MRLAWAMVFPPDFIFVTMSEAKQASLVKRKDWIASSLGLGPFEWHVIPGHRQRVRATRGPMTGSAMNPEFRDSGFALRAPRNDGRSQHRSKNKIIFCARMMAPPRSLPIS